MNRHLISRRLLFTLTLAFGLWLASCDDPTPTPTGGGDGDCDSATDECAVDADCGSGLVCNLTTCECVFPLAPVHACFVLSDGCTSDSDCPAGGYCDEPSCNCKPLCPVKGTPCDGKEEGESCEGPNPLEDYECRDCKCVEQCSETSDCQWPGQPCESPVNGIAGYCKLCSCIPCNNENSPCYDKAEGASCQTPGGVSGRCRMCQCVDACPDESSPCHGKTFGEFCYDNGWGTCLGCDCIVCPEGTECYQQSHNSLCTEAGINGRCVDCACYACPPDSPCANKLPGTRCIRADGLRGTCQQDCTCEPSCSPAGSTCYGLNHLAACTTGGADGACISWEQAGATPSAGPIGDCECEEGLCPEGTGCAGKHDGWPCYVEGTTPGNLIQGTCHDCECMVCQQGTPCYDKVSGSSCTVSGETGTCRECVCDVCSSGTPCHDKADGSSCVQGGVTGTCRDCDCDRCPNGTPCRDKADGDTCTTGTGEGGECHDCECLPTCPPEGSTCYGQHDGEACTTGSGAPGECSNTSWGSCHCCLPTSDHCLTGRQCRDAYGPDYRCDPDTCNCYQCPSDSHGCLYDDACPDGYFCDPDCNCTRFPSFAPIMMQACFLGSEGCTSDAYCVAEHGSGYRCSASCNCYTCPEGSDWCTSSGDCPPDHFCDTDSCVCTPLEDISLILCPENTPCAGLSEGTSCTLDDDSTGVCRNCECEEPETPALSAPALPGGPVTACPPDSDMCTSDDDCPDGTCDLATCTCLPASQAVGCPEGLQCTTQYFPVYDCVRVSRGVYHWYEAEALVDETGRHFSVTYLAEHEGPWQPNCPGEDKPEEEEEPEEEEKDKDKRDCGASGAC